MKLFVMLNLAAVAVEAERVAYQQQ